MRAITISREYGSGGGEVARRLAEKLHWRLLDHQIIVGVARKLGITERTAQDYDEYVESLTTRIFESLRYILPDPMLVDQLYEPPLSVNTRAQQQAIRQIVLTAAALGKVVIVGRGAQVLLAPHRDILHVRVVAPLLQRVRYVMQRENLSAPAAQARTQRKDAARQRELKDHYHRYEADALLYDLIINTGVLDLQSAVDLTLLALQRKAQRLAVSEDELGPGAGLARYPAHLGDLGPPFPDPHAE